MTMTETTAVMTGGQALVAALAAHGVDTVFGIPGTHNLEIYRDPRQASRISELASSSMDTMRPTSVSEGGA